MTRTDGSVTAGGNTLIMRNPVFTLLHPFTFRPFDISSGNGSVPFQGLICFELGDLLCPLSYKEVSQKPTSAATSTSCFS